MEDQTSEHARHALVRLLFIVNLTVGGCMGNQGTRGYDGGWWPRARSHGRTTVKSGWCELGEPVLPDPNREPRDSGRTKDHNDEVEYNERKN